MTYQMIQSVAVTGDIYQQFISYLLHESETIHKTENGGWMVARFHQRS